MRHALEELRLPAGSFVFVVSDFLVEVPSALWLRLRARGLDVVPVVVQDPTWEQSFPLVAGIVLPIRDPLSGRVADLYVRGRDARHRRTMNEQRRAALLARFRRFGFDPVLIDAADPTRIGAAFTRWADRRRQLTKVGTRMTGIRVTVAHARIGLGEPFTVTVDAQGTGTLSAPDGPFVEVGSPRITRSDGHIRIVKSLVCVDRGCAPDGKLRTVSLPAATLTSGGATTRSAAPPSRSRRACRLWPYRPRGPPTGLRLSPRRHVAAPPRPRCSVRDRHRLSVRRGGRTRAPAITATERLLPAPLGPRARPSPAARVICAAGKRPAPCRRPCRGTDRRRRCDTARVGAAGAGSG